MYRITIGNSQQSFLFWQVINIEINKNNKTKRNINIYSVKKLVEQVEGRMAITKRGEDTTAAAAEE